MYITESDKEHKVSKDKSLLKKAFGEFQNVLLSEEEHKKLSDKFPDWKERIERLSVYKSSKGINYKSDYATILNWALKDEKEGKATISSKKSKETPSPDSYFSGKYGKVVNVPHD